MKDRIADQAEIPDPRDLILAFATLGTGSNEEARMAALLADLRPQLVSFNRKAKVRSFWEIYCRLWRERPRLAVMEGTGLAGGAALLLGKWLAGVPYVVSSGDAVGPFVARQAAWAGPLFALYERLLCRCCAGFIGWTPYLVGRALTFGAPRAVTAAGFAPFPCDELELAGSRQRVRESLGIPGDAMVFGLVGSLVWNHQVKYCYGMELVAARAQAASSKCVVLVVGDGSGLPHLQDKAGPLLGNAVFLPGRVPQNQVPHYLAAIDVLSLPQSVDRLGSFRYTTKLSEYLAVGLPVVTGEIPLAYDLDEGWLWRLPGDAPWEELYIRALGELMTTLTPEEYARKKQAVPRNPIEFDRERQVKRVREFILDLLKAQAKAVVS